MPAPRLAGDGTARTSVSAETIPFNWWWRPSGFDRAHPACCGVSMVDVGTPATETVPLADVDSLWLVAIL